MKIVLWKRLSYALAAVALTAIAIAAKDVRTITIRDDCDPATFNAAVGPGTCVGGGGTTFDEFLAALPDGDDHWRFNNDRTETDDAVNSANRGGETHTFTEVANFGNGFIPVLNNPDDQLAPECATELPDGTLVPGAGVNPDTLVPAGGTSKTQTLSRGTHKFQCCIHPWMRSTVTRR